MKKTNVMIEVSDDLYYEIVEPYKKRKGFGKLVVQLLEAYRNNDQIYSFINGTMDGLEDEATNELLRDLNSMADSLSMFGALQNQAEVTIDEGKRAFDSFADTAYEDRGRFTSEQYNKEESKPNQGGLTREDVVNIVNDSLTDVKKMLKDLMDNGVVSPPIANQVQEVVETKVHASINEVVVMEEIPAQVPYHEDVTPVIKEASDEDAQKAMDAIGSLMGSLNFT